MKKSNSIEKELNSIRVALYEEMKGMSPSEMTAYMKAQTAPLHEMYGIRPVNKATHTESGGNVINMVSV